ncbi:MAG: hypothetical protein Mars2KO_05150 [Maribacter sp.]
MAPNRIQLGHITIGIGETPLAYDIAVVSTDIHGNRGALNTSILKELGYSTGATLDNLNLKEGYDLVKEKGKIPVLFIVTIGEGATRKSLAQNLQASLGAYTDLFRDKNIWVPLLGTGSGRLKLQLSFDIIFEILFQFLESNFMISLPSGRQGEQLFQILNKRFKNTFQGTTADEIKQAASQFEGAKPDSEPIPDFSQGNALREAFGKHDFYFASYFFEDQDIGKDLLDNSRWGHGVNSIPSRVTDVRINDILFLSGASTGDPKGEGERIEVRAVGVVTSLYDETGYLGVAWREFDPFLHFNKYSRRYFETLIPIRDSDIDEILTAFLNQREELEDDIRALLPKEKIPFHDDKAVDNDQLGREPVAIAFVDLLKDDVFKNDFNYSFMVHLQGEWGAGKSSFLKLIKKHLQLGDGEKWVVVEYNAWQNQHIDPPWWTLIDQVYTESLKELPFLAKYKLILFEKARRIKEYSSWRNIISLTLLVVLLLLMFLFKDQVIDFFKGIVENENKTTAEEIGDFLKVATAIATFIGGVYGVVRLFTTPFFANSPQQVKTFVLRASDPQKKVKKHFKNLVENINGETRKKKKRTYGNNETYKERTRKRQLAIFIDDIDRCSKEFIIRLLEGIQTLFKENRVLFIVAGDKNWITKSFGEVYSDFAEDDRSKHKLGEFFVEKAFQLSLRLPNVSKQALENYWNYILGNRIKKKEGKKLRDIDSETKVEINRYLNGLREGIGSSDMIKEVQDEFNLEMDAATSVVIDAKNADGGKFNHLLSGFYQYVNTNPRSIKRLANAYTMTRSTLIAEQVDVEEKTLLWWLILEDLCHPLSNTVQTALKMQDFHETILQMTDQNNRRKCIEVYNDYVARIKDGHKLLTEIKALKGIKFDSGMEEN